MRVVTLGDALLDVIVRLETPLAPGSDVRAATRAGAGGQAANVAAWAVSLGAEAAVIAAVADDAAGRLVREELAQLGVPVLGPVLQGATGTVVSVVTPDGERSLASDRGVGPELAPRALDPRWLDGCDVLHLSGYALVREPIRAAAETAAGAARARGARLTVDVPPWTELRARGPAGFRSLLGTLAPDVLFATEAEWQILGGAYLTAPVAVVKRGSRGITVLAPDTHLDLAAADAEVVDATGAGDALAAGFLLGGSLEEAGRRGVETAGRCVGKVGAMP